MDRSKYCGCKGVRTCLLCEEKYDLKENQHLIVSSIKNLKSYVYCMYCDRIYAGWDENEYLNHPDHNSSESLQVPGIYVMLDFLNDEEETDLLNALDAMPWDISQSGRRKQNFGPSCNFKKRKIKLGAFRGFPKSTKFVQDKFRSVPLLDKYFTIEQCSLEYDPARGASIDPHIDDCWIWGERIVTVNLLADTVLILTKYKGDRKRYNLDLIPDSTSSVPDIAVRIPMPRKSLIVLYGDARYNWEHCILREDVTTRRVCVAYREFTLPYLPGGDHEVEGKEILETAKNFW